jgi:hypothetical protein
MLEVIAVWTAADPAAPHRAWADHTAAQVEAAALPGGYPNLLAPEDTGRVRQAYGGNHARLLAAKRRYDPDGVFSGVPTLQAGAAPQAGQGRRA